jgi:Uma2 family endonuclease
MASKTTTATRHETMEDLLLAAADRFELTEKGLVEKVARPAHGTMVVQISVRLTTLGVPPERIFPNVRLTPERSGPWAGNRYVPDLFVVRESNPIQPDPLADYSGAPDLMIEILSAIADDRERDLVEKRGAYAARGVPYYWIADPLSRQVTDGYRQERWVALDDLRLPWETAADPD